MTNKVESFYINRKLKKKKIEDPPPHSMNDANYIYITYNTSS